MKTQKQQCEFLRSQAKRKFDNVRETWIDCLRWTLPHRATWLLSQTRGDRKNQHIVDGTHLLAQRSNVAGFLEGNTSATRNWVRIESRDQERNENHENKAWLQHFTERVHACLSASNFYHAAGGFYYDLSSVNTGAHYIEQREDGPFFHTLMPGSYYVINDAYGEACIMVREYCLNVLSIVDEYGTKDKIGQADWSNISNGVKKMYEDGNYSPLIDIVQVIKKNPDYDYKNPDAFNNREWLELTYEIGASGASRFDDGNGQEETIGTKNEERYLKRHTCRRKPFIVGKSSDGFEYGEKGPTTDSLGLIKSLNKKAIAKDRALEQMLAPTLQGPAQLRKNYISNTPNTFIPIDARSASAKQKIESVFQIDGQGLGAVINDVTDLRGQVDKFYFADFLLYLSKNPKTRTATETNAIVEEQQRIIGPNLQSLNFSYNMPILDWVMDYVLHEDPYLDPPPADLAGQSLKPEMISVFAQAQRAADLPSMDRFTAMVSNVGQMNPAIWDKINLDKLCDLYEDRLFLPSGLNNSQSKVEAKREQANAEMKRQQQLQETIPAMAKAAKDVSSIQQQK
jgi:hypothetical protein